VKNKHEKEGINEGQSIREKDRKGTVGYAMFFASSRFSNLFFLLFPILHWPSVREMARKRVREKELNRKQQGMHWAWICC
jgi:hypothetical protein